MIDLIIKENGIWRSRVNDDVYEPHIEPAIVTVIQAGILRWLGTSQCNAGTRASRKLTFHKTEGNRRVDRRTVRWLDSVKKI